MLCRRCRSMLCRTQWCKRKLIHQAISAFFHNFVVSSSFITSSWSWMIIIMNVCKVRWECISFIFAAIKHIYFIFFFSLFLFDIFRHQFWYLLGRTVNTNEDGTSTHTHTHPRHDINKRTYMAWYSIKIWHSGAIRSIYVFRDAIKEKEKNKKIQKTKHRVMRVSHALR